MTHPPIEVAKLGGSLLSRIDFVPAVRHWLAERRQASPAEHLVLVVGGGPLVEALRGLDALRPLDEQVSHWQAIELMEVAGRVAAAWLPELAVVETLQQVESRCHKPGVTLMLLNHFLREDEPQFPGVRLPVGWQVTSDSIAARLAVCVGAARLRLVKSVPVDPAEAPNWRQLAEQGRVDAFFPNLAGELPEIAWDQLPTGHKLPGSSKMCVN